MYTPITNGTKKNSWGAKKKSSQWWLYKALQEIFPPGIDILEEYEFPAMQLSQTGYLMSFDIYVPSLHIILEYHGYQHYYDHYMFGDVKVHKERDYERRVACAHHSITYLEVPYWWQHDKESVIAVIHRVRPDIVPDVPVVTPFQYSIKAKPNKEITLLG